MNLALKQTTETRSHHLELIQGVITRMAQNSFALKGWSVTLVSALFFLSAKDAETKYALLSLFPALFFWGLDAYYLLLERHFRDLYDAVREGKVEDDAYSMNHRPWKKAQDTWWCVLFSKTVLSFHLPIVASVVGVVFYMTRK